MSRFNRFVLCTFLPAVLLSWAQCQSGSDESVGYGIVPFHTYLGENEHINVGTGNVHVQIPLIQLPGRNGHNYSATLTYNSQIWHPETIIDGIGNTHNVWIMNTPWNLGIDGQYIIRSFNAAMQNNSGVICKTVRRSTSWRRFALTSMHRRSKKRIWLAGTGTTTS